MMKVLKGFYKGVELTAPETGDVRPTVDHFKKHLIKIFEEARPQVVWDLFAGGGGVGIEFLSLGAQQAVFVEQLKRAVSCLNLNLANCRLKDTQTFEKQQIKVVQAPVETFLKSPESFVSKVPDLVFMDPPYGEGFMKKITPLLLRNPLCTPKTLFVAEHVVTDPLAELGQEGILQKQEIYGPKVLSCFSKRASRL